MKLLTSLYNILKSNSMHFPKLLDSKIESIESVFMGSNSVFKTILQIEKFSL